MYLHIRKGTAVSRMVVRLPSLSMAGPPKIPPKMANSGIKLLIQENCNNQLIVMKSKFGVALLHTDIKVG